MNNPTCVICDRPMPDTAFACSTCATRIGRQLATIAELTPDARAVAARQTRRGAAVRGSGHERALPFDPKATEMLDDAQNALTTWVRYVADERGVEVPSVPVGGRTGESEGDAMVVAAQWLTSHLTWFRHRGPEVVEFARDVTTVTRILHSIVDPPRQKRYAGPCPTTIDGETCGTDLYARAGQGVAACRVCGWEYNVDAQQAWMREQVRERLARPVEIAGILGQLGFAVAYSTIAAYVAKGQIVAVEVDGRGRALYRIGDVMDLRVAAARAVSVVPTREN